MLDLKAVANTEGALLALIGQRIAGVLRSNDGHLWLVTEAGDSFVLTSFGGGVSPSFWWESKSATDGLVKVRQGELDGQITRLTRLLSLAGNRGGGKDGS